MNSKTYSFQDHTGDAQITVYEVYPGIQLAYHSVHMEWLKLDSVFKGNLIEIHHCCEGRIEQTFENACYYLMPGDLSVAVTKRMVQAYHFPLRHYHGMTICIDMDEVPDAFRKMLQEIHVQPMEVARKLCADKPSFILRQEKQIEHVFAQLYGVPDEVKEGYFKVRILELFLVLSGMSNEQNRLPVCMLSKTNVLMANRAAEYLSAHMDEHITIAELARMLGISQSHLKTIFKGVYGVPVFSYTRILKMQTAGYALIHTDKSTADIAEEFGYANASKFAAAFQDVMGESPSEYRKAHRKQQFNL